MNARMLVAVTALVVAGFIIPTGCGTGGDVPGTGTNAHESSPVQTE